MESIVFDRASGQVTGADRQPFPFEQEIKLPFSITLNKTSYIHTDVKHQKVNEEGQPLFYDDMVVDSDGNLLSATEVSYGEKVVNGVLQALYPVMEAVTIPSTTDITQDPLLFTASEVVEAKKAAINANNFHKLVYYSEDLDESEFSTDLNSHDANMGNGFISLNPMGGQVRTNKLDLGKNVTRVDLYLEAQPDIAVEIGVDYDTFFPVANGAVKFDTPVSEVYVRFINHADTRRDIYAFGLLA